MHGAYALTHVAIDQVVRRTSPGNYALGYMDGVTFVVFYVGRSDSDVRQSLRHWVLAPSRQARYAPSARAPWGSRRGAILPLAAPVLARVSACADTSYTHFAYSYADSAEAAFDEERRNFGDFGGVQALDNDTEPVAAGQP
jgi:hypothetical protein